MSLLAQAVEVTTFVWSAAALVGGTAGGAILTSAIRGREKTGMRSVGTAVALDLYKESLNDVKDEIKSFRETTRAIDGLTASTEGIYRLLEQLTARQHATDQTHDRSARDAVEMHKRTNKRIDAVRNVLDHLNRNLEHRKSIKNDPALMDSQDDGDGA